MCVHHNTCQRVCTIMHACMSVRALPIMLICVCVYIPPTHVSASLPCIPVCVCVCTTHAHQCVCVCVCTAMHTTDMYNTAGVDEDAKCLKLRCYRQQRCFHRCPCSQTGIWPHPHYITGPPTVHTQHNTHECYSEMQCHHDYQVQFSNLHTKLNSPRISIKANVPIYRQNCRTNTATKVTYFPPHETLFSTKLSSNVYKHVHYRIIISIIFIQPHSFKYWWGLYITQQNSHLHSSLQRQLQYVPAWCMCPWPCAGKWAGAAEQQLESLIRP